MFIPVARQACSKLFNQSYHDNNAKHQLYLTGNVMHNAADAFANNQLNVIVRGPAKQKLKGAMIPKQVFAERPHLPLTPHVSAQQAFERLIEHKDVGAYKTKHGQFHDSADTSVLAQIKRGISSRAEGSLLIDHERQNVKDIETYAKEFR